MNSAVENKGQIIIYQTPEGETELEVKLERDTLWLNQYQLADLFETDRTSILKHIRNTYEIGELSENSTCAKFAQVRKEGKRSVTRQILHYNLDIKGLFGSFICLIVPPFHGISGSFVKNMHKRSQRLEKIKRDLIQQWFF